MGDYLHNPSYKKSVTLSKNTDESDMQIVKGRVG